MFNRLHKKTTIDAENKIPSGKIELFTVSFNKRKQKIVIVCLADKLSSLEFMKTRILHYSNCLPWYPPKNHHTYNCQLVVIVYYCGDFYWLFEILGVAWRMSAVTKAGFGKFFNWSDVSFKKKIETIIMDRRESSDTQQFSKLQIHQTLHSYHTNNRLPRYFAMSFLN